MLGSWWIWLIILPIALSIASLAATFLFLFFGLPVLWSYLAGFALLGAAAYIYYRGYGVDTWGLAACGVVGGCAALGIVWGLTVEEPTLPDDLPQDFVDACTSSANAFFLLDYSGYADCYSYTNANEIPLNDEAPYIIDTSVLQWDDQPPTIWIYFPEIET